MRSRYRLEPKASQQLDDIYDYTVRRWGGAQADRYITDLFDMFSRIAAGQVSPRRTPKHWRIAASLMHVGPHVIYWRIASNDDIEIVSILHQRMAQAARLREDLGG